MKIIIKNEEREIIISDEGFDSRVKWLNVQVKEYRDIDSEDVLQEADIDILLNDLIPTIIAFDVQESRRLSQQKDLED